MTSARVAGFPNRATSHRAVLVLPLRDGKASAGWVTALPRTGNKGKLADAGAQHKVIFQRYQQPCAAQARATKCTENARPEARNTQLTVDAACNEKRGVRVDRRPRLREAEIANIPFMAARFATLTGALRRCSSLVWLATRRYERLALHPASPPKNVILTISASLTGLSSEDRKAFATVESNVARGCR